MEFNTQQKAAKIFSIGLFCQSMPLHGKNRGKIEVLSNDILTFYTILNGATYILFYLQMQIKNCLTIKSIFQRIKIKKFITKHQVYGKY